MHDSGIVHVRWYPPWCGMLVSVVLQRAVLPAVNVLPE